MRRVGLLFSLLVVSLLPAFWVHAQDAEPVSAAITSPNAGQALRGKVIILGNTAVTGFISWELTFSYAGDTTGSWFLIAEGAEATAEGELAEWDTTTITDGNYQLRLTVYLDGDRRTHFIVPDLRVRNYTLIETETATPTSTPYPLTPQPSYTATLAYPASETPVPSTPTPLPTNPIEILTPEINNSLQRGALGTLAFFVLMGLYLRLKHGLGRWKNR